MQELDLLIRAAAATLLLALALLLVRSAPRDRTAWLLLVFALGLCGFLAGNTPDGALRLSGTPAALARLLSGNVAVFLWWFSLAVFDDDFRLGPLQLNVGGAWFIIFLLDRHILVTGPAGLDLSWVLVAMGAAMVAHVAYRLLRDLEGDLIEARRRSRALLAAVFAALLLVDLGVDVALGFEWKPHWFTIAQNAAILLVAAQMARWLLRADAGLLTFRAAEANAFVPASASVTATPVTSGPDARLLRRLTELMESERVYRDPDLTFTAFAARMGAPEAEVRRLVNQKLGHRHFRSFLNAYRLADAREALGDPAKADRKMVTIAFDAGFASLPSFNRAFKLAEGKPPTEFRAERLSWNETSDGRPDASSYSEADMRLRTDF